MRIERDFQQYFVEHSNEILKGISDVKQDIRLCSVGMVLAPSAKSNVKDTIGYIDVTFMYYGRRYVGEIKYGKKSGGGNFWDGIKVLGYTAYYNWQNDTKSYPAILMPLKDINLSHQLIAQKLKIALFGIVEDGDEFILKSIKM